MKKFITLSLLMATMMFTAVFAEAAPKAESQSQQWQRQTQTRRVEQNSRYNRRGVRVVTRTRLVRAGSRTYRETIQIKYLPNGKTQTKVLSRVRVR